MTYLLCGVENSDNSDESSFKVGGGVEITDTPKTLLLNKKAKELLMKE